MRALVIGGGVAGLMAALRCAHAGYEVSLFEAHQCGSGASTKNQGMIHSGAMYAKLHPEIVPFCIEAQDLFATHFGAAKILDNRSLYYGTPDSMLQYRVAWKRLGIIHRVVSPTLVQRYFLDASDKSFVEVSYEGLYSAKGIIDILVRECRDRGVRIFTGIQIKEVIHKNGRVEGVRDPCNFFHPADIVVNASGIGIRQLLQGMHSIYTNTIASRLGSAVVIRNRSLDRVIVSTNFKGCNLAPTSDGYIIVIIYGANQPWIDADGSFCVIGEEYLHAMEKLRSTFVPSMFDVTVTQPYSATKTEFIDRPGTDQWGVHPGHYVVDHSDEGISGVYSCIPGKLTLSFHATRDLMEAITKSQHDLALPKFISGNKWESQVDVAMEPWKSIIKG